MYAVQQPLHLSTFDDVMGTPAWKSLPSRYLVAQHDEVIPPDAERQFAQRMRADTIEVASGHCAMISHPEETHDQLGRLSPSSDQKLTTLPSEGTPGSFSHPARPNPARRRPTPVSPRDARERGV
jgi:hypothetical protein